MFEQLQQLWDNVVTVVKPLFCSKHLYFEHIDGQTWVAQPKTNSKKSSYKLMNKIVCRLCGKIEYFDILGD